MNKQLFYSSSIIGIIIIIISFYFYSENLLLLYVITYFGIISSIVNHGVTSKSVKNLDRCIMIISAIVYVYYGFHIQNLIMKIITLTIVGLMMILYISTKFIRVFIEKEDKTLSTNIHTITHCISLLPFCMIILNDYFMKKNDKTITY